jgi:hypothetical protein
MKDGHVNSLINKVVLYGASGTGKSSFMDLVVDNPQREIRTTTPLAVRPVSVFQIDLTNREWTKLTQVQRKEMLAKAMVNLRSAIRQDEEKSRGGKNIFGDEKHAESKHNEDPDPTLKPVALPVTSSSPRLPQCKTFDDSTLLKSIDTCGSLVQMVKQCSRTGEVITSYHKIIFIDSGGQPQFHEMLPVFLRRMTLYTFVFKLSEELAAKPEVEYYDSNGERVGTPYQSPQTNVQLLQHCLRILNTHRIDHPKSSRIMVVGTHRDLEDECTTETRADKNRKLASIFLPTFKDEVTYSNLAENEFIFAVNAKDPQTEDKDLVKYVRRLILTEFNPDPVKVPLRYYCLEIVLEEASQTLGRGVLSIDECLVAAAELNFDKHTLGAALEFLDGISVIFYFPEVLEDVVFTDPQVLLDKATEPVEKIHSLRKGSGVASGKWQNFKEHALFTKSLLQNAFQKHYVAGLFTSEELIKLFRKLLIVADFNSTEYFMPALLDVLEEDKVSEHRVPHDSPAAALTLDFPLGGPHLGTFCALTSFLISSSNRFPSPWKIKLLPDTNTPTCLYRNCIQFSLSNFPGVVTLIDNFAHFEIHVDTASRVAGELCAIVRHAIFAGLVKANLTLGYTDCTPSPAILCPCNGGSPHVATWGKGASWICKRDSQKYGDLTPRHLMWPITNKQDGK